MTPLMYERVRDMMVTQVLPATVITQPRYWRDTKQPKAAFVVFSPSGGSAIRKDLGSEYMVKVDVIGPKDSDSVADEIANLILSFVQDNPMPNDCIGHIENVGGFPRPMLSAEGRVVYSLLFACLYGE
ncbi:hypothetical protein M975_1880 [Buttiauxella brennerae ATCC 51605]|uniref:Phage protein n=1 Tax=Buttiauxella brennerae ATCC 51605 TaxID=1354251 RepID=A0A1B7IQI3_9ENTR|nr:hypothetical protein [Buttiauxella brennerae]OAT31988.1 hypothetical protein M975_1880 [Buttiauxella brennerae ATCC 51605]